MLVIMLCFSNESEELMFLASFLQNQSENKTENISVDTAA